VPTVSCTLACFATVEWDPVPETAAARSAHDGYSFLAQSGSLVAIAAFGEEVGMGMRAVVCQPHANTLIRRL
jgi:hypothetical protein